MRRLFLIVLLALGVAGGYRQSSLAQSSAPQPGDPPVLALIRVSPADADGIVTISGDDGATFASATVFVRNLYTGATVAARASTTGKFSAQLYGPGNTPFWISPSALLAPADVAAMTGSLPGGPGVILYGATPNSERFTVAGQFVSADGTPAIWSAVGRTDSLEAQPGQVWQVQLDVTIQAELPEDTAIIGAFGWQPVARSVGGEVIAVGDTGSNNGWSSILTPSGIAIDNLNSSVTLGEVVVRPSDLVHEAGSTRFVLNFLVTLPRDLPRGLYIPIFDGFTRIAGERAAWNADTTTRLPLVVSVGGVHDVHLPLALFYDNPSDGSRGILSSDDQSSFALSNRVHFNSLAYVLPPTDATTGEPITYSLEPYLLNEMANRYDVTGVPLIPFALPGGSLQVSVVKPDGTTNNYGSLRLRQSLVSTAAQDESVQFGTELPVDVYHVTTGDPRLMAYSFDQYGDYRITLSGSLSDVWGNRYSGGGDYNVIVAEPLDLTPGVMAGTPFEVGDAINLGVHLAPGVPAHVVVTVRIYPLDGSDVIERVVEGDANANGYFQPNEAPLITTTPGEYVIDYQARYEAPDGRLWAASLRGAGVIAAREPSIIVHGERGVPAMTGDLHLAWFDLRQYARITGAPAEQTQLNYPYHSGDVAWIGDGPAGGMTPELTIQDGTGVYADALVKALPDYLGEAGRTLRVLAAQAELPLVLVGAPGSPGLHPDQLESESYGYISAVRPNVSVRQFVADGGDSGLALNWDEDDPLNQQIGAGVTGDLPDDFTFLFGGAVLRVNTDEGQMRDTAIYGSLAVVTAADELPRVYPPGRGTSGGAAGGPLLTYNGDPVDAFVNLTALQPGDVLRLGDTVGIAGQVAPTLPSAVTTTLTSPSGQVYNFAERANKIGYFYNPDDRFRVDETGIWTVDVQVTLDSATSAGEATPPLVTGGVLGSAGGHFSIYVLPPDAATLDWNPRLTDVSIPAVSPYNFSFTLPGDWTDIRAFYTLSTPGMIIEQGELRVYGRSVSYQYSPVLINRAHPNLESESRVNGAAATDVRTLTFAVIGTDAAGVTRMQSRSFTLMYGRLITMD